MGLSEFLGFGNPYTGAPQVAQPNPGAYQVPNQAPIQQSLGVLQQFAQTPGIQVDQTNSQQDRLRQQQLIDLLLGSANGTGGPSAAQIQQQQGLDQALAQSRAVAQSVAQQTANPIAALQAAGGQQSLLQRQALGDAASLRAQEQLAARAQLEQALSSQRYGDVTDASQRLQAEQANRQTSLGALSSVLQGNLGYGQLQQQSQISFENARLQAQNLARQQYIESRAQDMANRRQLLSTFLQVAGTAGAAYLASPSKAAG